MLKILALCLTMSMAFMHPTGSVMLLYGTGSAGKSSISKCLERFFVDDAVFVSVDEISWKPLIEQAKICSLINDQMPKEKQYDIMMQHMDMLDSACGSQWIVHLKQFYDKVKQLALTHRYVIVDTVFYVDGDNDTQYFLKQMKDIPVFSVLVYAPCNIIARRIVQRNTGLIHEQKRDVMYAMSSFCDLYVPVSLQKNAISLLMVQEIKESLEAIQNYWIDCGVSANDVQEKTSILQNLYHKTFFLNGTDAVGIAPRFVQDMMVHTGEMSSQQCAQLIYETFMDKQG
jgi:chloramphenicol 3-O-phosphotransferase